MEESADKGAAQRHTNMLIEVTPAVLNKLDMYLILHV